MSLVKNLSISIASLFAVFPRTGRADVRSELLRPDLREADEIFAERSLLMSHSRILRHPKAGAGEPWSFGGVMKELARAHFRKKDVSAEEFNAFVRQWLQSFESQRPGIRTHLTCLWALGKADPKGDCNTVLLRPENAPFKLLAANYRPDFAKESCEGEAGEFRLTYGLTLDVPRGRHPADLPGEEMTLIFEYDLAKVNSPLRPGDWAMSFEKLSSPDLCSDFCGSYLQQFDRIMERVTQYDPSSSQNPPIALGQLRSNELVGDPLFTPALSASLRAIADSLSQCYLDLVRSAENPLLGLQVCSKNIVVPAGPTAQAVHLIKNVVDTVITLAQKPGALPIPKNLVSILTEVLAGVSNRIFPRWEMREAELNSFGLQGRMTKDTPDLRLNNSVQLRDFVNQHEVAILDGSVNLNLEMDRLGLQRDFQPLVNPFDPWRFNKVAGLSTDMVQDARLRSKFAQLTCGGCHATQAGTNGLLSVLTDILTHAPHTGELLAYANTLLQEHKAADLHLENIDAFYMISPIRNPGFAGQAHLARFLTKDGGDLDKRAVKMLELVDGVGACRL